MNDRGAAMKMLVRTLATSCIVALTVAIAPSAPAMGPRESEPRDASLFGTAAPNDEWAQIQFALDGAANRIYDVIVATGLEESGWAGFFVDVPADKLDVYWVGPLPAVVAEAVRLEEVAGISVRLDESARYSKAELGVEVDSISQRLNESTCLRTRE